MGADLALLRMMGLATSNIGTTRLKDRLEVDACLSHATRDSILDVGLGRAALPLAAAGRRVSGVGLAQATLDECQRFARGRGLQISTGVSSLEQLPFADETFGSVISLNVLVRFQDWRRVLREWARVVGPGGRLVFDLPSDDHYRAALGSRVAGEEPARNPVWRVSAEDLVAEAEHCGLAVRKLMPYGAFLGDDNPNLWLGELENKYFWKRLLSWLVADEALFEFALFLEQELVAHLTTTMAGRFMAVLEKRADRKRNQAWLERNRSLDYALRKVPIDPGCLAGRLGCSQEEWRRRASAHVSSSLRCRRLLECLATKLVASRRLAWADVVDAPLDAYFCKVLAKREDDQIVSNLSRSAPHDAAIVAHSLSHDGIALGGGFEYFLVERLLTKALGRFTGVRT